LIYLYGMMMHGLANFKERHNISCKFRECQAYGSKHKIKDPLTHIRTHTENKIGDFENFWERKIHYIKKK